MGQPPKLVFLLKTEGPRGAFAGCSRKGLTSGEYACAMHVAIVSPYDPRPLERDDPLGLRGGVEEALDRCAAGLVRRGHEVTVVTTAREDASSTDVDGVRFERVRRRGVLWRTPLAPLGKHVPADADVVHVPGTYPFVSDMIPLREWRRGRPTILDYHFDPHGTSAAMRAAAALHRGAFGWAMRCATRVVTKSRDYARHSRFLGRIASDRVDCVPNGVDLERFRVRVPRTGDILCVGRLVPYKGVDVLVRAMRGIHSETGARLRVVGDGPEAPHLRRLAREMDAPVDFLGRVPHDELPRLYASSRLTVLPSVNSQEAFGIALLESMAAGTPVVASDLPGVREVAGLAGITARPNDAHDLADAVTCAWHNAPKFGSAADIQARVEAKYSWDAVLDAWIPVYERAVESRGQRTPRGKASWFASRATGGSP